MPPVALGNSLFSVHGFAKKNFSSLSEETQKADIAAGFLPYYEEMQNIASLRKFIVIRSLSQATSPYRT